jgi:hypothetical protein
MPFSYDEFGHILIPVNIADSIINFVFDTGSSISIFTHGDKPSKLQLTDSCIKIVVLSKMSIYTAKMSYPVKIKFNEVLSQSNVSLAVFDTIDNSLPPIIGMNIINKFFWHFDFVNKTVTISKASLPVPEKSETLYYTTFEKIMAAANSVVRINNSSFPIIMDTGYTIGHMEYDRDSIENIVQDTNVILSYMTKDEENIKSFVRQLGRTEIHKYYNRHQMDFDTITINQFLNMDKSVSVYVLPELPQFYDKKLFLTLNFFKQFEQMYIDTKKHTIYLKSY